MAFTYEELISPESLSYVRDLWEAGEIWQVAYDYYNQPGGPTQYLFFRSVHLWAFDQAGTLPDAVVTQLYSSSHPSYSEDTVEYIVPWTPVRLTANTATFLRTYLTESTEFQISFTQLPDSGSSSLITTYGLDGVAYTWRNDTYQGSSSDAV